MRGFKEFFNLSNNISSESQVVFLYTNGLEWNEISKETGRSKGDIQRILEKNHVSRNRLKKKHTLIDHFKDAGYLPNQIADYVGMSPQGVRYVLRKNNAK